jgi:hypothetical protein
MEVELRDAPDDPDEMIPISLPDAERVRTALLGRDDDRGS